MTRIIGIDFDNTIVCCDEVFFSLAVEMGMVPSTVEKAKNAVRDYIRAYSSDEDWSVLQSEVYGPRLREARPYPGASDFLMDCREHGVVTHVISHKSQYPAAGKRHDLHQAALSWLSENGFFATEGAGLSPQRVVFAPTRRQKLDQIRSRECSSFVDDLPEVFAEGAFPPAAEKILFDPKDAYKGWTGGMRILSWGELREIFFHAAMPRR